MNIQHMVKKTIFLSMPSEFRELIFLKAIQQIKYSLRAIKSFVHAPRSPPRRRQHGAFLKLKLGLEIINPGYSYKVFFLTNLNELIATDLVFLISVPSNPSV